MNRLQQIEQLKIQPFALRGIRPHLYTEGGVVVNWSISTSQCSPNNSGLTVLPCCGHLRPYPRGVKIDGRTPSHSDTRFLSLPKPRISAEQTGRASRYERNQRDCDRDGSRTLSIPSSSRIFRNASLNFVSRSMIRYRLPLRKPSSKLVNSWPFASSRLPSDSQYNRRSELAGWPLP